MHVVKNKTKQAIRETAPAHGHFVRNVPEVSFFAVPAKLFCLIFGDVIGGQLMEAMKIGCDQLR